MNVLVTGASGFIGSALVARLEGKNHFVQRLVRRPPSGRNEIRWDPETGRAELRSNTTIDAVIHLAGEPIMGRWTSAKKERILTSRVHGTNTLVQLLSRLPQRPNVLVSASAIGFYGDRADELLTEDSAPGTGFLPEVCRRWEEEAWKATQLGTRVVALRTGIVLSPDGGALGQMLLPFKMGVGGIIGSGNQFFSWVTREDLLSIFEHALTNGAVRGPVNAVGPAPVTNREFTKTLGEVLRRPTIFPLPAFMARLALGEMAEALLLASARVRPDKLLKNGFQFKHPDLKDALAHVLRA